MFRFFLPKLNNIKKQPAAFVIPPLNSVSLVGVVHDVQGGYIGTDFITQFQLAINLVPVDNDCPLINPLPSSKKVKRPVHVREREYFTIRASGLSNELKAALHDGAVVSVEGMLKTNVQPEPLANHKLFANPFIWVKMMNSSSDVPGNNNDNNNNHQESNTTATAETKQIGFIEVLHTKAK
jgi:hypothetical protein